MEVVQPNLMGGNAEPHKMNFFQRVLGVFLSPGKVMDNLAAKPRVLFPILMMVLAPAVFVFSRMDLLKQEMSRGMEEGMKQAPNAGAVTPEQLDWMINFMVGAFAFILPIFLLLAWVVGTAILFGIARLFKGGGRFKQYLSVTGYGMTVTLLELAVIFLASVVGGTLQIQFSPAMFIPTVYGSFGWAFLKSLLSGLDLFALWYMVVVAIGVCKVSGIPQNKTYRLVFGLYAAAILLLALLAGVSSLAGSMMQVG